MKKRIVLGILLIVTLFSSCGRNYNAGTYEAVGAGRNGDIRVSIVVNSEGQMTEILVLESSENARMMKQVVDTMTKKMIEKNTSDVDIVSGATESSNGYKEAVKNALEDAKK